MKPNAAIRHFLALAGSSLLAMSFAHAVTVNWNGSTSATWADADNWDTAPANNIDDDIANFDLATYDGLTVFAPNAGTTSINGITIGSDNGAMTLTTTNLSIGGSGISIANGAGAFTMGTTTLGADQNWTNNSANLFTFGAVTNGGNRLTIGGSGNSTTSSNIAGTGGLTKTGAGTLTLSGTKAYTGTTVVDSGKLVLTMAGSNNIINDSTEILIGNGATIEYTNTSGQFNLKDGQKITGTGTTGSFLNAAANTSLLSVIALGNNTISSSGTLTFSRLDAYKAGNVISGGSIQAGGITTGSTNRRGLVIGNGAVDAATLTITGGKLTSLGGSAAGDLLGNQSNGIGTLIVNGGEYVNTASTGTTTLGNGTGTGTLTLTSGSATIHTLVLNPGNNRSATVNLDGGTLTLNTLTSTVTGTSTRVFNFHGGQFEAAGTVTFATTLTTNVKDGGAKIDTQGNSVTVSGALVNFAGTSTGGLTKSGSGTLTLSGSNTFIGATTVSAGLLSLGNSAALQNSTLDTTASIASTSATTGLKTTVTTLTLGGLSGDKDLASLFDATNGYGSVTALTLNPGTGATPSYSGSIANGPSGMSLNKTGAGTQTLSGNNSYSGGTTISNGTLTLTGATQETSSITFTGGSLGLDTGFPVAAASAAVNLDNGTITVTGSTGAASYTLLTAASITSTGTPQLADPAPAGYELQVIDGDTTDELRLVKTGAASAFDTWAATGTLGPVTFDGDTNGDGVQDGLSFLLGVTNPDDSALGKLPQATESAGGLVLTFQMLDDTANDNASLAIEYSNSLADGSWTTVQVPYTSGTVDDVVFTITGTNPLNVSATIPAGKAADSKLFARLKGTNP